MFVMLDMDGSKEVIIKIDGNEAFCDDIYYRFEEWDEITIFAVDRYGADEQFIKNKIEQSDKKILDTINISKSDSANIGDIIQKIYSKLTGTKNNNCILSKS